MPTQPRTTALLISQRAQAHLVCSYAADNNRTTSAKSKSITALSPLSFNALTHTEVFALGNHNVLVSRDGAFLREIKEMERQVSSFYYQICHKSLNVQLKLIARLAFVIQLHV